MFRLTVKLTGICLIFFSWNTGACEGDKKYGEECSAPTECSEIDLLGCQNGICTCSPSASLFYEDDLKGCVARVGEKCGGAIRADWSVSIPCVEGALCDESGGGYCVCTDDYYRLQNGTCAKKRKYMEICKSDLECAKDSRNYKPLVCDNGLCNCDRKLQIYDNERRQCVTLAGGDCGSPIPTTSSYPSNECSSQASCLNGKCTCDEHYTADSKGLCQLKYGESCGIGRSCSDLQLTCLDGVCQCKYPLHQAYDKKTEECLSLVSGPCTLNDTKQEDDGSNEKVLQRQSFVQRCTKNTICADQGFFAACECLDGFVQKIDGQCAPGFGESCEADECDPITPLYCRNSKCDCRDELQMYDVGRRKCLGLVGSRCMVGLQAQQCVEFSSCIQVGADFEGRCLCDKYSEEVENRTCIYE